MPGVRRTSICIEHRSRRFDISYWMRPAEGSPILYLHGLGSTKEDFLPATRREAISHRTLVALDYPGVGESRNYFPEIPLGIDDLVILLGRVVDELSLDDLTIVGHSMGGLIGLIFASNNTDKVGRFMSVEGNLSPEDCDLQSRDVFRHQFLGNEDGFFESVARRLGKHGRPGFQGFLSCMRNNIADRAYFDYCRSIVDYSDGKPLLEYFTSLPMPKSYVHGSTNAGLSHIRTLVDANEDVVSVPGSDHFPIETNPDYFFSALARFAGCPTTMPSCAAEKPR